MQQPVSSEQDSCLHAGTDFRTFSRIEVSLPANDGAEASDESTSITPQISVQRYDVEQSVPADPVVARIAAGYADVMGSRMSKVWINKFSPSHGCL